MPILLTKDESMGWARGLNVTIQEHSYVLSRSARMTLCVLLQELLGCPKMKIQNKLGRQKKKICVHSDSF